MTSLPPLLDALQSTWYPSAGGGPVAASSSADADALIRSVNRKARIAQTHMAVLAAINWPQLDNIGRQSQSGASAIQQLHIALPEASLTISHPAAVIDHVYLSFDGLTASLVNMTDTMGRLFNVVYGLRLDPRRASLFEVNTKSCVATSALGTVLNDPGFTDWLRKVRDLRGRCQHADLDGVLVNSRVAPLSMRTPPIIDVAYSWRTPPQQTMITDYAQQACVACETCMTAVIKAVLNNPVNPTI